MVNRFPALMLVLLAVVFLGACGTVDPSDKALLKERSRAALTDFKTADPSLNNLITSARAYVVFPRITTGAIGIGGAYGEGEVYENGKFVGYADVKQGSVGFQLGGQVYSELILFTKESNFLDFKHNTLEFDARYSAIAASAGKAGAADYSKGVVIFTQQEGGLMFQAAIGGQKFTYRAEGGQQGGCFVEREVSGHLGRSVPGRGVRSQHTGVRRVPATIERQQTAP